jgi:hypothetical protein
MHTMRREHEYEKYSKLLGRRIVCCVAQPDFFLLVCTCGARKSAVYKLHRQEKGYAPVSGIRAPQMLAQASSKESRSQVHRRPTMRAPDAGESARFTGIFPASACFSLDGVPPSAPAQVMRAVGRREEIAHGSRESKETWLQHHAHPVPTLAKHSATKLWIGTACASWRIDWFFCSSALAAL